MLNYGINFNYVCNHQFISDNKYAYLNQYEKKYIDNIKQYLIKSTFLSKTLCEIIILYVINIKNDDFVFGFYSICSDIS